MFRALATRASTAVRQGLLVQTAAPVAAQQRLYHPKVLTNEEFDQKYVKWFQRKDLDGWELRKGLTDVIQHDLVPDPVIINAALHACRRLNEYSLCVRFLESVRYKCGPRLTTFWPYILQEIRPTLNELGIETPEELGYDKPELELEDVYRLY